MKFFTETKDYEPVQRLVTIPANTSHFNLSINIIDDKDLEDNEFVRITICPPEIPDNLVANFTDVIIEDNDGKLLIYVEYLYYLYFILISHILIM